MNAPKDPGLDTLRFGSGVLAACLFTSAQAAEYSPDQFLFGDWNGSRTRLHEAGVDLQITYVNELAWNTQGGDDHTGTYSDQLMFDAALVALLLHPMSLRHVRIWLS